MSMHSVFAALSIALITPSSFMVGCDSPTAPSQRTDQAASPAGTLSAFTRQPLSSGTAPSQRTDQAASPAGTSPAFVCQPLNCSGTSWKTTLIPEDAGHCAIVCCGEDFCLQDFIPWVDKTTGKTDKWYDWRNRKMVDIPGGE